MKLELNKEEIEAIIKEHIENKFQHEVVALTLDYSSSVEVQLGAKKQPIFTITPNQTLIKQPTIYDKPCIIPTISPWDITSVTNKSDVAEDK